VGAGGEGGEEEEGVRRGAESHENLRREGVGGVCPWRRADGEVSGKGAPEIRDCENSMRNNLGRVNCRLEIFAQRLQIPDLSR
jgi:hypothetical protein